MLLKNLYNMEYMQLLSNAIIKFHPEFQREEFIKSIFSEEWDSLELKERVRHISKGLGESLPEEYSSAISILKSAFLEVNELKFRLENTLFQDFVEVYGLEHFEESMKALQLFTINSTSEFAIRAFILKDSEKTMEQMKIWCESENEHIRRLASEGCRTRLPWAVSLPEFKDDPAPVIEIIKLLIDDPSEYVRRSVGNSLNDISKDNPEIVKSLTESLMSTEREHTLKQGLRTLLKRGDREALSLFGFEKRADIRVENFEVDDEVKLGTSLRFSFTLKSEESLGRVRVEYLIEYLRKNGTHSGKVFKISEFKTDKKERSYCRQHSFKVVSTRRYYGGIHKVSIIINGELLSTKEFTLTS